MINAFKKVAVIPTFWLKIIAIISMTIDHIGLALEIYYPTIPNFSVIDPLFRSIGRLALPIFCFLIVEGVLHTKSFKKYVLRLSIIGVAVLIAELLMNYIPSFGMQGQLHDSGNIFIDLTLGAIGVYALKHKNPKMKLLVLIPIAFGICSTIAYALEKAHGYEILWMPFFLRTQYNIVSIILILGFYGTRVLISAIYESAYHIDADDFEKTDQWRFYVNVANAILIVLVGVCWYLVGINIPSVYVFWLPTQIWMLMTAIPIVLYSGKEGFKNKIFQYGCYLYYPIHILIIYLVFYLITL